MASRRVQKHYEGVAHGHNRSQRERKSSKAIQVKEASNYIKTTLVNTACAGVALRAGRHPRETLHVLDLGCGCGGDLQKWNLNANGSPVIYHGCDISETRIEAAVERWVDMARRNAARGGGMVRQAHFKTNDMVEELGDVHTTTNEKGSPEKSPCVVSCMFALHYAVDSWERAGEMARCMAEACVRDSTVYIGTVVNFERLCTLVANKGDGAGSWSNSLCSVQFDSEDAWRAACELQLNPNVPTYGITYTFSLCDSLTSCPECNIPTHFFELVRQQCGSRGQLSVVSFPEWQACPRSKAHTPSGLWAKMCKSHANAVDHDSREVLSLYDVFILEPEPS